MGVEAWPRLRLAGCMRVKKWGCLSESVRGLYWLGSSLDASWQGAMTSSQYVVIFFKLMIISSSISDARGEETCTFGHLFLNDAQSLKVVGIDLDTEKEVYQIPDSALQNAPTGANGPALYPSSDSQHIYVNYRAAEGLVRIIKVGITLENHGDHADVLKATPTLLDLNVTGDMPTHFTMGMQKTVIFFDGRRTTNSSVMGFVDTDLSGKGITQRFTFGPIGQQHGIASQLANDHYIISQPNPDYIKGTSNDSLSVGFIVVNKDGTTVDSMNEAGNPDKSCPGYHGHAKYGTVDVFGCAGGFLSITHNTATNTFTSRQVKYHDTGRKTGTFFEHERQPIIIGQHSGGTPAQVSLIRWVAGTESYNVARDVLDMGPVRPCGGAGFELALGKAFAALLMNGSLMVYDVAEGWALLNSAAVDPFSCSDASRPRMVMGYHRLFLLYPAKNEVVEFRVSLSTLTKGRTIKTTTQPVAGVVVGLSPSTVATSACTDGVVLQDAEKAATKATSNSTAKSSARRVVSASWAQQLLSASFAGLTAIALRRA
jgi:hypothetical protein